MTKQEIQYLLQIMNNAEITGRLAVFHVQLMSKLVVMAKEEVKEPDAN